MKLLRLRAQLLTINYLKPGKQSNRGYPEMASKFIENLRADLRMLEYSMSTEKAYLLWIRRFICFTGKGYPSVVPLSNAGACLTYLAANHRVSITTQKTVLSALAYPFEKYLERMMGDLGFELA